MRKENNRISLPKRVFRRILFICARFIPDRLFLKLRFPIGTGYKLNLKNPKTFNEKLQWLKLYDRKQEYTEMVDKVEAKRLVARIIGEEHIIPTLAVYEKVEDINFDILPNQFVLKCTHDSGGIVICKNKSKFNRKLALKKLEKGLKRNFFWRNREWPYKNIKPRIIAEKYMTNSGQELEDFKIHCFNGIPKAILHCCDRYKKTGLTEDFYTTEWDHLDISRPNHPQSPYPSDCPIELKEMLHLSEKLSEGIPFLRTDFYVINHKVYFGELTFFPASGMQPFIPKEWDDIFGSWILLPNEQQTNS